MTYDTVEELWNSEDDMELNPVDEDSDGMSLETQYALIRNANLQYCIANHLI
ncbi:MAG: hypothetical protein GY948_08110 [Alphaproteobacteria bacterium]|nr:hypothetical protein [Alphaproteobacteria bacterium]